MADVSTVLRVKNMVCRRCVLTVEDTLDRLDIRFRLVSIGEIYLTEPMPEQKLGRLADALAETGLELIDDRRTALIEQVKRLVIARARNEAPEGERHLKLSAYLTSHLHLDYSHLSNLFSSVEGRTIENFFIRQRIERAKELLVYDRLTLSEIAWELGYSSAAHLSNQFRQVTGLTPTHFKEVGAAKRKPLDEV